MTIETAELTRTFKYNSVDLPDPGPQYTVEQVRDLYSATYPEITSAAIEGPEQKDGKLVYSFRKAVGTKGAELIKLKETVDLLEKEMRAVAGDANRAREYSGAELRNIFTRLPRDALANAQDLNDQVNQLFPGRPAIPESAPQSFLGALFHDGPCAIPLYSGDRRRWVWVGLNDGEHTDKDFDTYEEALQAAASRDGET